MALACGRCRGLPALAIMLALGCVPATAQEPFAGKTVTISIGFGLGGG